VAKRFNLQTKIILITLAAAAVVLISVSLIDSYWAYQLADENRYDRYIALTQSLARRIRDGNYLEHPAELAQELRSVKDYPLGKSVTQIDVFVHNGPESKLVASTSTDGKLLPEVDELTPDKVPAGYSEFYIVNPDTKDVYTLEHNPPNGPQSWVFSAQIRNGDQVLGCVNLMGIRDLEYQYLSDLQLKTVLLIFATIAALLVILSVLFWWFFRRPMHELIGAMAQAETGNLAVQANVFSEDEIGTLASNFNRMLTKIRYANDENQALLHQIKDFNEVLSQKVLQATTELAEKNRELRHVNQLLFETQRTLATSERQALAGQMAASLAHEIGTPLNAISGHVQLISKTHARDEKTLRRLKIIASQIDQITATVKNLLMATRQARMSMRPVEVNELVLETLALTEPVLNARGIIVKTDLGEKLPQVFGDADRLRQVLLNLINNSIDAMPHGGRLMIHSFTEIQDENSSQVVIEIRDTGCGIDSEDIDRIFEPMFTTKRIGEGVGLGLAICRETVEEHDGRIIARSEPSNGAVFIIQLPAYQAESREEKLVSGVVSN